MFLFLGNIFIHKGVLQKKQKTKTKNLIGWFNFTSKLEIFDSISEKKRQIYISTRRKENDSTFNYKYQFSVFFVLTRVQEKLLFRQKIEISSHRDSRTFLVQTLQKICHSLQ